MSLCTRSCVLAEEGLVCGMVPTVRSNRCHRRASGRPGRWKEARTYVLPAPVVAVVGLAALVADAPLEEVVDEALDAARRLADLAVDAAHHLTPRGAVAAAASPATASSPAASRGAVAVGFRVDRRRALRRGGLLQLRGGRRQEQHAY